jgi:hypothetical protein
MDIDDDATKIISNESTSDASSTENKVADTRPKKRRAQEANSLKQNLQVILTDHLKENEVFVHKGRGELMIFPFVVYFNSFLGAPRFFPRGHCTRLFSRLPQRLLSK